MTGGALLDRIAAAGAAASLDPDGRVRIAGASRLAAELIGLLRENRAEVARELAARRGGASAEPDVEAPVGREEDPTDAAERAAMADHHAAPPDPAPWRPDTPDPLRDGLLTGWRASRPGRLADVAERLEAVRPRRVWGVAEMHWRAWEAAARDAAGLPTSVWSAWRAAVGTAQAASLPRPGTSALAGDAFP